MGTPHQRDLLMPDSMMREVLRLSVNTEVELNIIWKILVKSVTRLSIGITVT